MYERVPVENIASGPSVGPRSYNILLVERRVPPHTPSFSRRLMHAKSSDLSLDFHTCKRRGIQAIEDQAGIPFREEEAIFLNGNARYTSAKQKVSLSEGFGGRTLAVNRQGITHSASELSASELTNTCPPPF